MQLQQKMSLRDVAQGLPDFVGSNHEESNQNPLTLRNDLLSLFVKFSLID